ETARLKGADVDRGDEWQPALIGRHTRRRCERPTAGAERRAAGEQRNRLSWTAVVAQGRQQWVDGKAAGAYLVAVGAVADAAHAGAVGDQVVGTGGNDNARNVRLVIPEDPGDDGVVEGQGAAAGVVDAAAVVREVFGERAVGEVQCSSIGDA